MITVMKVILYDLLMLTKLFFDFVDREIDRGAKIFGAGFAEVVHVVAGDVAMSQAIFTFHAEVPGNRNSPVKILL